MTKIAAATWDSFCSFFETEVTSMFIKFSMLSCVRSFDESWEVLCDCGFCPHATSRPNRRNTAVHVTRRAAPSSRFHRFSDIAHTPRGHVHVTRQPPARVWLPSLLQSMISRFGNAWGHSEFGQLTDGSTRLEQHGHASPRCSSITASSLQHLCDAW